MRGVYTVTAEHTAIAAAENVLVFFNNSAMTDYPVVAELLGATITNADQDTNEQLVAGLFRVTGVNLDEGVLGGAVYVTPEKHETADSTSVCSVSTASALVETDQDVALASMAVHLRGFSTLGGYWYDPLPETRVHVRPDDMYALRITTPTFTSFSPVVSMTWREIG